MCIRDRDKEILLSERLKMNASFVPYGASVADVGCDHGYVAIYLLQQGIAKPVSYTHLQFSIRCLI